MNEEKQVKVVGAILLISLVLVPVFLWFSQAALAISSAVIFFAMSLLLIVFKDKGEYPEGNILSSKKPPKFMLVLTVLIYLFLLGITLLGCGFGPSGTCENSFLSIILGFVVSIFLLISISKSVSSSKKFAFILLYIISIFAAVVFLGSF